MLFGITRTRAAPTIVKLCAARRAKREGKEVQDRCFRHPGRKGGPPDGSTVSRGPSMPQVTAVHCSRRAPPLPINWEGQQLSTRPTCLTLSQPVSCIIDSRRYRVAYILGRLTGIVDLLDTHPRLVTTYSSSLRPKQANHPTVCPAPNLPLLTPLALPIHISIFSSTRSGAQGYKLQWPPTVIPRRTRQQC